MVALLGGCTGRAEPSTPAERAINPETITRDNPAGDALSPTDAALERLLSEKLGRKIDKFETIQPAFADAKNWKRIRFFGYPTRGGFRYGKDPSYAAAVLYYWEAEDDAPTSCIEHFAGKAQRIADVFDLDVGPLERRMADHRRGVEAVDWSDWEKEWEEKELERIAKLKDRLEQSKKRRAEMRTHVARRRFLRAFRLKRKPIDEAAPELAKAGASPGQGADGKEPAAEPEEATKTPEELQAETKRKERLEARRLRVAEARRRRAERIANMTPEEKEELEERRKQAHERRKQARARRDARLEKMMQPRPAPVPKHTDLGAGDMPIITTSGAFTTLFNRDRYLGAMVAYDSWPGTCLVQGFAVKVGSDEALAQKVLDRWLEEMAPILRWHRDLREQPPTKNR